MERVSIHFFDDREVRAVWTQLGSVTTQFKLTVNKTIKKRRVL